MVNIETRPNSSLNLVLALDQASVSLPQGSETGTWIGGVQDLMKVRLAPSLKACLGKTVA